MPVKPTIWAISTATDWRIAFVGSGSAKKLRHAIMWVVNKKGRMGSKTATSRVPIIVKKMIIAIVLTMGPMEFSEKHDRVVAKVAMVIRAKYDTPNPQKNRQGRSLACKITNPSLFSTIKSPMPNSSWLTKIAIMPNHSKIISV